MGFVKKIGNPAEYPVRKLLGDKTFSQLDLGGQVAGVYDDLYKPEKIEPIPTPNIDASANVERDRARRLARKAAGRDSTIRTSSQGAPYSGAPKSLLGS